ncbi:MAG: methyl-accepting chemotaxis protein [Thermodesulfobacteriota bacterium]
MRTFGIGKKMMLGGLSIVIIPLVVVGFYSILKASNGLQTLAEERAAMTAATLAKMTELALNEETKLIREIALDSHVVQAAAFKDSQDAIAAANELLSKKLAVLGDTYEEIFAIDEKGIVFSDSADGKMAGMSLGDRAYFQTALQGAAVVSDALKSKVTGAPIVVVAAPILDPAGKICGVAGTSLKIDFLIEKIVSTRIGETGYPFMVNKDGLTIAHPKKEYILDLNLRDDTQSQMETIMRRMLQGEKGVEHYVFNNTPKIAGFAPVAITNWSLAVTQDEAEFMQAVHTIRNGILLVGFISLTLATVLVLSFSRSISQPLVKAASVANAIAVGDLSKRVNYTSRDEVGSLSQSLDKMAVSLEQKAKLAQTIAAGDLTSDVPIASETDILGKALQKMVLNLNDVLGDVNSASMQVSAGTSQVSESSQSLSQGATEQASSLEEITSSVTELASQTKSNAENASQANQLAVTARNTADKGNTHMQGMVAAMTDIAGSSKEIAKIIKAIDDIAFQTNLLALNAAVEAARAGKHGKGFAVVAQEVRNLAWRSAKAAQETTELIEGAVKKVENGTEIVNQTAAALNEIVSGATKVADLVAEIASASNEQAQGISQINQALSQVDQVTQSNTANAEETAAAAEELSGQAVQLQQLVSRFKLNSAKSLAYSERAALPESNQTQTRRKKTGAIAWGENNDMGRNDKVVDPAMVIALDESEFGRY